MDEDRIESWEDELASLVDTMGVVEIDDRIDFGTEKTKTTRSSRSSEEQEEETLGEAFKGFLWGCGEMIQQLGKACRDVVHQNLHSYYDHDSHLSHHLGFLNHYLLPEDRHPLHAWPLIFLVFTITLSVLCVNTEPQNPRSMPKKVYIHPRSASLVRLPDGRQMAYHERGVPAKKARFCLVSPHSFLSSRLAGIPGIKEPLLEEFGVSLISYDLPGFGESDPHPNRDLNTSAMDMLHIADAVGVSDKFWVVGYSGGGMHAWAALSYIPDKLAGAAMFAPIVNPYDSSMSREERCGIWEKWTRRRKLMYFLARRFPGLLTFFYRQSFLSGDHSPLDKCLSLSLGKKDRALVEEPSFERFWQRDVEESIRQGNVRPFVEEAFLQVSNWGFSLSDIQVKQKRREKGILPWLKSMYSQAEMEWAGFLGPIHIWQGMNDEVVTPTTSEFISRLVPGATVHKLPDEGHLSYFCFCDECHREIFSTLFGAPQGAFESSTTTTATATATATGEVVVDDQKTSSVEESLFTDSSSP